MKIRVILFLLLGFAQSQTDQDTEFECVRDFDGCVIRAESIGALEEKVKQIARKKLFDEGKNIENFPVRLQVCDREEFGITKTTVPLAATMETAPDPAMQITLGQEDTASSPDSTVEPTTDEDKLFKINHKNYHKEMQLGWYWPRKQFRRTYGKIAPHIPNPD